MDSKDKVEIPKDDINRDFWAHEMNIHKEELQLNYGNKINDATLKELSEKYSKSDKTLPNICVFYTRGECNRGSKCPYRHIKVDVNVNDEEVKKSNTGSNDPIAQKILSGVMDTELPKPPENKDIKTLFVGGVVDTISQDDLRNAVSSYGEVKKITTRYKQSCAFVTFSTRVGAELAMQALYDRLYVNDIKLKLIWSRYSNE
jgi:pre-mRNA-splicing factor RBM22/SLT11